MHDIVKKHEHARDAGALAALAEAEANAAQGVAGLRREAPRAAENPTRSEAGAAQSR